MKCSVIVANYNHADVILVALRSIEAQTYDNWEVVIVDDASIDNSIEVVQKFISSSEHKEKYKLVPLSKNMGVGHAKKTASAHSSGDIIAICDPDDAIHPEAIYRVVQLHQANQQASIVYTNYYFCDAGIKPKQIRKSAGSIIHSELKEDKVSAFASFKSRLYLKTEGFDSSFRLAEDKDLFYKLEEVGDIIYLDEPLYYYRIWPRGISQGFDAYVRSRDYRLIAIKNAVARRKASGVKQLKPKELRTLLAGIHLLQAEGILYSDKPISSKFMKHLAKAILLSPSVNLKRKIKTTFLLTRAKRGILGLLGKR